MIKQIQKAIQLHYFETNKESKELYLSCDIIAKLIPEFNSLFVVPPKGLVEHTPLPEYQAEVIRHMPKFNLTFLGLPVFRIVEDGKIIVQ